MARKRTPPRPKAPLYGPHYLRQWREDAGRRRGREYTLEEVGEIIGISHAQLGRIERRLQKYNQELLEALAELYGTDPASLIMRDPTRTDGMWSLWDRAGVGQRKKIEEYAELLVRSRTGTAD
jgi:transcriptional regulator with XRE-family HTH domain